MVELSDVKNNKVELKNLLKNSSIELNNIETIANMLTDKQCMILLNRMKYNRITSEQLDEVIQSLNDINIFNKSILSETDIINDIIYSKIKYSKIKNKAELGEDLSKKPLINNKEIQLKILNDEIKTTQDLDILNFFAEKHHRYYIDIFNQIRYMELTNHEMNSISELLTYATSKNLYEGELIIKIANCTINTKEEINIISELFTYITQEIESVDKLLVKKSLQKKLKLIKSLIIQGFIDTKQQIDDLIYLEIKYPFYDPYHEFLFDAIVKKTLDIRNPFAVSSYMKFVDETYTTVGGGGSSRSGYEYADASGRSSFKIR